MVVAKWHVRRTSGAPKALAVALSFCRLLGLGCPKQAFAKIATPRNRFFDKTDMEEQIAKQKAFFTMAFGGPNNYTGGDMRTVHARLVKMGLDNSHFDAVMEHLGATMTELGVPDNLIEQAAAIAESTRKDVLGK